MAGHYSAEGQSLNAAARELDLLVDEAVRFQEANRHLASVPEAHGEWRTAVALELAAARLLALAAAPLMPRFAAALAGALGLPPAQTWNSSVELVPPGATIDLAQSDFFSVPRIAAENARSVHGDASHAIREGAGHAHAV